MLPPTLVGIRWKPNPVQEMRAGGASGDEKQNELCLTVKLSTLELLPCDSPGGTE